MRAVPGADTITATAPTLTVGPSAKIAANGSANGGTILLGGDRHGGSDATQNFASSAIPTAHETTVAAGALISADGGVGGLSGDGGRVVVWSDNSTSFGGSIFARGGAAGGNGGFVETSGGNLDVGSAASVNTLAPNGSTGTWLLDPKFLTVVAGVGTIATLPVNYPDGGAGATSTISASTINGAASNVVLQANTDITVDAAIAMTGAGVGLTMNAGRSILVNQNISTNGGAFTATINDAGANAPDRDAGQAEFTMASGTSITTTGTAATAGAINISTGTFGGGGATNIGDCHAR